MLKKTKEFDIKVEEKTYKVTIIYKMNKYIHYRFKNGQFYITSSRFASDETILNGLYKYAEKLIDSSHEQDFIGDDFIMLLGYRINISDSGEINFSDGSKIVYKSRDDLKKKLRKYFLGLCQRRVAHYTKIMDLPLYTTRVRDMNTRHGSNSLTSRTVWFSTNLMHFSLEIIDSVVIHELAHIRVFNHSKKFYDLVYKYCHNYDELHTKLRKGIFK